MVDTGTLQIGSDIAAQSEQITVRNEERKQRTRTNRAVIESKKLPRELLASADRMSTETVNVLGKFLSETDTEEHP
jgi:hypothetical protein